MVEGNHELSPLFLAIARPIVRNGASVSLWSDCWGAQPASMLFKEAAYELTQLRRLLSLIDHSENGQDCWRFIWSNKTFASKDLTD
ncbi:hypothetical protein GUJ93_ZPchr0465g6480 [Zizania palustris]|uniref:Uncharacterized protein n=1 Tax=Zizania palustris TaxID=103762 RepID=A0A8J5UUC9_ZIZPA|nr:hypothetical protein GUJ93_ZPchr0465g6480 [Zizania palustris]